MVKPPPTPAPPPKEVKPTAVGPIDDTALKGFLDFIRRENHIALAALLGNAFFLKQDGQSLTFFFDASRANLIPMVRSGQNGKVIEDAAKKFFRGNVDLNFSIGRDPNIRAAKDREKRALEDVQANPIVKYLMEQFNGTIINCKILEDGD
ncbi:hypothetical protein SCOR_21535 [Sulfidibacter corallicola]|uniref:Uncharacterized protein n=1 Tax=Sulfidibacter corallicola TaxID=2818388 RepID=A0A8A4TVG4_SULCO|nr:hypothetical protein [Sulfidibacter corallicola]QTD52982.1 hypothetical protein J3U87_11010 [Sulfidibacter corallicola]